MSYETKSSPIGKIHSFESFGTVDGPGIRFVLFMQGCIYRCLYCHNPDTFDMNNAAFTLSPRQAFDRMKKYISYYKRGGITISGGEPLMQPAFVKSFFQLCKAEGLHTAIDTTGYRLTDEVKEVLEETDLVLLDIKCIDHEIHKELTGQPLQPTLDFAEYLSDNNIPMWVRYVLVPNLTDEDELIKKHADYLSKLSNVEKVEVLPFHKLGESKYEQLGIEFKLKNYDPPTEERVENAKNIYKSKGIKVK